MTRRPGPRGSPGPADRDADEGRGRMLRLHRFVTVRLAKDAAGRRPEDVLGGERSAESVAELLGHLDVERAVRLLEDVPGAVVGAARRPPHQRLSDAAVEQAAEQPQALATVHQV